MSGARFFQWLQSAEFYRDLHSEAVATVPATGGTWFDVGCGPGLVVRLAASRGFEVTGFDLSASMVALTWAAPAPARFERAGLAELIERGITADVVSAASLLFVLPEPRVGLSELWRLVSPGGHLLIVETTPRLNAIRALSAARGPGASGLVLWGMARCGRSVAPVLATFDPADLVGAKYRPLCSDLVGAWLFEKKALAAGSLLESPPPHSIKEMS
jgi:ubiquinone/menaquinone biosynthesis C-methylase UbiE